MKYPLLAILILLLGCGPMALPGPTSQEIEAEDLIGRWQYPGSYGRAVIQITFKEDGTFSQHLRYPNGDEKHQNGKWKLDGAYVELDDVLMHMDPGDGIEFWSVDSGSWWFVDSRKGLQLYGGYHPDPDSCWPLKYLGKDTFTE